MKGWAQKTLAGMTLEQKLGQLMVSFMDDEADMQQEAAILLLLCSDCETGSTFGPVSVWWTANR